MIYVIGDLMLDSYINGEVNRLSPEAPVPILLKSDESFILGGACNVASNIKNLTKKVKYFGIVGDDKNAALVKKLLGSSEIDAHLIFSENAPTIKKTRFFSSSKQILRVDEENKFSLNDSESLFKKIKKESENDEVDLFVISDYNKNTIHPKLKISEYINMEKTIIDSKKTSLEIFKGAKLFKCNFLELQNLLKNDLNREDVMKELNQLRDFYNFEHVVTTLGPKGCVLSNVNNSKNFKTEKVEVSDVTGAGDNFIATLAFMLWKNKSIIESIDISLKYATESVKHVGNFFDDIMNIKE